MSEITTNKAAFMRQHAAIWGTHSWPTDAVLCIASDGSNDYKAHGSVPVADAEGAWRLIEPQAKKARTTYITLNPRAAAPARGSMGKRESVELLAGFFVDIDISDEGSEHSVGDQNPTRAEAEAWISRSPTPTVVNMTGGGFHLFYALEEPVDAKSDLAAELLARHRGYWTALAEAAGKSIDVGPLDNISQAPRPSGTWNKKQSKPVELISAQDWQWTVEKLLQYFPAVDMGAVGGRRSNRTGERIAPMGSALTRTLDPDASIGDRFAVTMPVGELAFNLFATTTEQSGAVVFPREDGSLAREANAKLYDDGEAGEQRLTVYGSRVIAALGLDSQNNSLTSWSLLGICLGGDFKKAAKVLAQFEDAGWGYNFFDAIRNIMDPRVAAAFGIDQDPDYIGPAAPVKATKPAVKAIVVEPEAPVDEVAIPTEAEDDQWGALAARAADLPDADSQAVAVPTVAVVDALINRIPMRHDIDSTKSVFLHGHEGRHGIYRREIDSETRQEKFIRLTDWVILKSSNVEPRTVDDDGEEEVPERSGTATGTVVTLAFSGANGYVKVLPGVPLEATNSLKTMINLLNVNVMIPERDSDAKSVENVIRVLAESGGGSSQVKEFTCIGWMKTDEGWVYLAPGGSLTAKGSTKEFTVGPPPKSKARALNATQRAYGWEKVPANNAEIIEAAVSIREFLKITPTKPAAYAVLGVLFGAPLSFERRTTVFLAGLPDNGKSLVAGGAQAFLTGISTSSGWTGGPIAKASIIASSVLAAWARHGVSIWDDFRVPTKNPQEAATMRSVVAAVLQAAYGNAGVGPKGTKDGGVRGGDSSSSAAIVTGEGLPEEEGVTSRAVSIYLSKGDVQMTPMYHSQFDVFANDYAEKAHLVYAAYLQFLARRLDRAVTMKAFRAENNKARSKVAVLNGRSAEGVAFLSVGWELFAEFAEEVGVPQSMYPDPAERAEIALTLCAQNEALVNESNPAVRVIKTARDMLAGGAAHINKADGQQPDRDEARAMGWKTIDTGYAPATLRESGLQLGMLSPDSQWVVLTANAVGDIAKKLGMSEVPQEQLRGGFTSLVMAGTTAGSKSPKAVSNASRPRGYVLPASMFDLEMTHPIAPSTVAIPEVAPAVAAPAIVPQSVDNQWGFDDF